MTCARLEPITQRFIDDLMAAGGPPVYTLSPTDARALLARQQSVPTAKPDAHIEDATFPVGPKGAVRVRIVRPERQRTPGAGHNAFPRRWLGPRWCLERRTHPARRLRQVRQYAGTGVGSGQSSDLWWLLLGQWS